MPIYEEKLVSPFAVRFTQKRVRSTFQDDREIEDSADQIEAVPGGGAYDLVLKAPFPAIEILRWAPYGRRQGRKQEHWFSFDNRRLYCLQRVAAEHWPKRVGCVVEVMYHDKGNIMRKLDSRTLGASVLIGHAVTGARREWSWREAVEQRCPPYFAHDAEQAVEVDEGKGTVHDLVDAPDFNRVERLLDAADLPPPPPPVRDPAEAPANDATAASSSSAAISEESGLTNLIGQLLALGGNDAVSEDKHTVSSEENVPAAASAEVSPEATSSEAIPSEQPSASSSATPQATDEPSQVSSSPASPPAAEENPLASLIGQLFALESKSGTQAQNPPDPSASACTTSTASGASISPEPGSIIPPATPAASEPSCPASASTATAEPEDSKTTSESAPLSSLIEQLLAVQVKEQACGSAPSKLVIPGAPQVKPSSKPSSTAAKPVAASSKDANTAAARQKKQGSQRTSTRSARAAADASWQHGMWDHAGLGANVDQQAALRMQAAQQQYMQHQMVQQQMGAEWDMAQWETSEWDYSQMSYNGYEY